MAVNKAAGRPKAPRPQVVVKEYALNPQQNGVKQRKEFETELEDAVSAALVRRNISSIVKFVGDLQQSLAGQAVIYPHGGLALYCARRDLIDRDLLLNLTQDLPEDSHVRTALDKYSELPRDCDFSVVRIDERGLPSCSSINDCKKECDAQLPACQILKALDGLRKETHASIAENQAEFLEEVRQSVNPAHVKSLHLKDSLEVEMKKTNGGPVRVMRYTRRDCINPGAVLMNDVELDPEKQTGCRPLRRSFNGIIEFRLFDTVAQFNLMRLALLVQVEWKGDAAVRVVQDRAKPTNAARAPRAPRPTSILPVNFVDVSMPKAGDAIYTSGRPAPTLHNVDIPNAGSMAYPSLAYVLDNTLKQLKYFEDVAAGLGQYTADNQSLARAKVENLKSRILAITIMRLALVWDKNVRTTMAQAHLLFNAKARGMPNAMAALEPEFKTRFILHCITPEEDSIIPTWYAPLDGESSAAGAVGNLDTFVQDLNNEQRTFWITRQARGSQHNTILGKITGTGAEDKMRLYALRRLIEHGVLPIAMALQLQVNSDASARDQHLVISASAVAKPIGHKSIRNASSANDTRRSVDQKKKPKPSSRSQAAQHGEHVSTASNSHRTQTAIGAQPTRAVNSSSKNQKPFTSESVASWGSAVSSRGSTGRR